MATPVNSVDDESDRISSLPDSILSHILSFLPTKEAIRTSVLSPRWRYLFASMSTFDFGRDCIRSLASRNGNNFKNFVDRLLHFPNPVSLECFRLYNFSWDDDESHLNDWISALLSRGVKELDLYPDHSHNLPPHLFTSHSLVTLKLDTYGDIKVPTDVCLPNLKTLHLKEFTLLDDSIYRLISSCVVLEELDLMPEEMHVSEVIIRNPSLKRLFLYLAVKGGRESNQLVEINAPNLVQFEYADDLAEHYVLSDMKSLKKAYIKIYFSDDDSDPTDLLRAICHAQSLYLEVDMSPLFSQSSLDPVLAFNNLVELELANPLGEWLVEFLHCVPNLKTLNMSQVFADDEGFRFIPRNVPSCLSIHLQEITLTFLYIDNLMFETVWYFLNHALVLEKLRVCIVNQHLKEESCILKKLLKLLRIRTDRIRRNEPYLREQSSTIKKLLKLLRIGIDELYSKEETSIITKLLRLHGSRAIEVSVELKDQIGSRN